MCFAAFIPRKLRWDKVVNYRSMFQKWPIASKVLSAWKLSRPQSLPQDLIPKPYFRTNVITIVLMPTCSSNPLTLCLWALSLASRVLSACNWAVLNLSVSISVSWRCLVVNSISLWACCCSVSARVACRACTCRWSSAISCSMLPMVLSREILSEETRMAVSSLRIFSLSTYNF